MFVVTDTDEVDKYKISERNTLNEYMDIKRETLSLDGILTGSEEHLKRSLQQEYSIYFFDPHITYIC